MTEWIISSTVLILVIAALRYILRGKISLRLQYALWGLVLVRLLLPFSFFSSPISVMNAAEEISYVELSATADSIGGDISEIEYDPSVGVIEGYYYGDYDRNFATVIDSVATEQEFEKLQKAVSLQELLVPVWLAGAGTMLLVLTVSNLHYGRVLRRGRREIDIPGSIVPVYVSEVIETPCLFGLFHPAVYISPECENDDVMLRHVVAHESTHYRHGDNLWSALRCVCLALHWYNPIVWLAAFLSRRDAELACDEGTIKHLGEDERTDYGRTLIGLTCQSHAVKSVFITATTMTGSQKSIRERITLIAKKPKMAVFTLISVLLIAAVLVGCTFSGAPKAMTDSELMKMAFGDAQGTALANDVEISDKGVLTREGTNVIIRFPVLSPIEKSAHQIVVTYSMADESGGETKEPYKAQVEYVQGDNSPVNSYEYVKISCEIDSSIPVYAIEEARNYIHNRAQEYEQRSIVISEAKLTGLTSIPTEASGNDFGILMYLVEYRLLPKEPDSVSALAYTNMEDGWITEQGYGGQPYMMIVTGKNGVFSGLTMYIDTLSLDSDYSTPGMLAKYGSKYTAACMERYYDLIGEENYSYYVMLSTVGVGISPYYHLKYERVWTEDGWLAADGKPLDLYAQNVPTVSIGDYPSTPRGYAELEIHCNPLIERGAMSIYRENCEIVSVDDISFYDAEDLYALDPGSYYVVFDIVVPGRYIADEDMREERCYSCVFRLEVTPKEKDVFYFTGGSESLVELYAREIHAKEMLTVEGDYAITDYKLVECELYAERVDGGVVVGQMEYAFEPINRELPEWWAGNTGVLDGAIYEGMLVRYNQFTLESRGDGFWECTDMGTGGAGGWGFIRNWPKEDALTQALTVLNDSATDKSYLLWWLPLINFADMDTNDFFELMDAVEEVCVGEGIIYDSNDGRTWTDVYPNDQFYRNMYCMKAALNCDGAYAARVQYIMNKINNHDPELFECCLQYFSSVDQDRLRSLADDELV